MISHNENADWSAWYPIVSRSFEEFFAASRTKAPRPISQWAEEEVIIPTGDFADMPYRIHRQPFTRLWFDELERGYWREYVATGPSQQGKSLSFYVIPILYYLFEMQETVICVTTTQKMWSDKWKLDLLPVITKSRYKDLLPKIGIGARGGIPDEITFSNGATLKNMTTENVDPKSRAYFTARVVVFTEVDGMQAGASTDPEASPIAQVEARTRSRKRSSRVIIKEGTPTFEDGYTWNSITVRGSNSKIVLPCPHCEEYVSLERENLKGWQDCENELEIDERTHFHCPKCDHPWTEGERIEANHHCKLLHKGQTIDKEGTIHGELPPTRTLGFRFGPANSTFLPQEDLGYDEWAARRKEDQIEAEKQACMFVWALPYIEAGREEVKLDVEALKKRTLVYGKGVVPRQTEWVTVGLDIGKARSWWVAIAWMMPERIGLIFDYAMIDMEIGGQTSRDIGFDKTCYHCIGKVWKGQMDGGWMKGDGEIITPSQVLVDVGYQGDTEDGPVVYDMLKQWGDRRYHGIEGQGVTNYKRHRYNPKNRKIKKPAGHYYHLEWEPKYKQHVAKADTDQWKAILRSRLDKKAGVEGSLMLYDSKQAGEHDKFLRHITAETRIRRFVPGRGMEERFHQTRDENHYLDAATYATIAGHLAGFRVKPPIPKRTRRPRRTVASLDGERPYFLNLRG